ncbi:MAG: alpha/beta hydrolase [Planctomycetota bacterium]
MAWWLVGAAGYFAATRPNPRPIQPLQQLAGHAVAVHSVQAVDGVTSRAWWIPAGDARRAVVLCAGIRGDRQRMLGRARFYLERGWSTLLVDLRGTGESERVRISMGWHEALDLLAWRQWLLQRGVEQVGVHGQSLGAAAAAFTALRDRDAARWHFLVLEACYTNLAEAAAARARGVPQACYWPMLWLAEWLLDLDVEAMDAVAALRQQPAPTLLLCGDRDRKVGRDGLRRLFEASAAADKVRYEVPGIAHRDLWRGGGEAVRVVVDRFLARRRAAIEPR